MTFLALLSLVLSLGIKEQGDSVYSAVISKNGMCEVDAEIHHLPDNHCFLIEQLNSSRFSFTSLFHVLKLLVFILVIFLAYCPSYYCFTVLHVVFCHHLLLQVRMIELGRVLVSHVAPGKAQLKIDLNDLDISPYVTEIEPSLMTYFGF